MIEKTKPVPNERLSDRLKRAQTKEDILALLEKPPIWKRSDLRRSVAIAVLSTVVLVVVIYSILSRLPGWAEIQHAFFSPEHLAMSFPDVLRGFRLNALMVLIAQPAALLLGLVIALGRAIRTPALFPLRALAVAYVDLFRGVPELLVILLLGIGMPALSIPGLPTSPIFWGIVAMTLVSSAFNAEYYRAGIESIHDSQRAAARSLGLSSWHAYRFVILPQAVRRVIPPLMSSFVVIIQASTLVSVIGPMEAVRSAQVYAAVNFNFTSYVAGTLIFVSITIPAARVTDYLLRKSQMARSVGGAV